MLLNNTHAGPKLSTYARFYSCKTARPPYNKKFLFC